MDLRSLLALPPWEWPEETRGLVLETLRDRAAGEEERALAATFAGETTLIDDDLARALLAVLKARGEPELLRCAAALALGPALELADTDGFDDPESSCISEPVFSELRRALHATYADADAPTLLRRRVLEAAVRAPEGWQEGAVRAAWAEQDDGWRLTAVFCMGYLRDGFDEHLVEALGSPHYEVRLEAVRAAGRMELDAAWPHVEPIIRAAAKPKDQEKELLLAAIDAAACIRPARAAELLEPLKRSRDQDIAEAAAEAYSMALVMGDLDGGDDDDEADA